MHVGLLTNVDTYMQAFLQRASKGELKQNALIERLIARVRMTQDLINAAI